jgi:hypothetical protein
VTSAWRSGGADRHDLSDGGGVKGLSVRPDRDDDGQPDADRLSGRVGGGANRGNREPVTQAVFPSGVIAIASENGATRIGVPGLLVARLIGMILPAPRGFT